MEKSLSILNGTQEDAVRAFTDAGIPAFRARQVWSWANKGADYPEMSNLPLSLRGSLSESFPLRLPRVYKKLVSNIDGTVKYLFSLYDGQLIESVVMKYEHGYSICISCQAGCRMGCRFCASTLKGLERNLEPCEMLGQIAVAQRDLGVRISNVVMMGIGEPMDNYDNVIRFLRLVNKQDGLGIGYRHISVSTCGVADGITKLMNENMPITLSVSLHFTDDKSRSDMMPVNNKWNIDTLLQACRDYFAKTGRRISFEFTLIRGKNDTPGNAAALAALLKKYMGGMPLHVNLIPVNEVKERGLSASETSSVNTFRDTLTKLGVNATVRRKLGSDINASCGQLRYNERKISE